MRIKNNRSIIKKSAMNYNGSLQIQGQTVVAYFGVVFSVLLCFDDETPAARQQPCPPHPQRSTPLEERRVSKEKDMIDAIAKVYRPHTGADIPILVFRAFRHFSANYVKEMLGRGANLVFQNSGRDFGHAVGEMLKKPTLDEYLHEVTQFVFNMRVGRLEAREVTSSRLVLGLDECITCAGMDSIGQRICHFETGFVAGVVETFVGEKVRAFESKCNANGEGICEVTVEITPKLI